jgi:hypothetical protein
LLVLLVAAGVAIGITRVNRGAATVPVVGASVTTPSIPPMPVPAPPRAASQAREGTEPPGPAQPSPVTAIGGRKAKKAAARDPSGRSEKPPAAPKDLFDDIR